MTERRIVIEGGAARFVYSDDLAALAAEGEVTRASHVEPHPTRPGWVADMRPSDGPVLGVNGEVQILGPFPLASCKAGLRDLEPFQTRQAALDAEREWLRKEKGL